MSMTLVALAAAVAAEPALDIIVGKADVAWERRVATAGDDWINDIIPLTDGNRLAVGFVNRIDVSPPSDWRAIAVKFSAEGADIWSREYGAGGAIDAFWTAEEVSNGDLVFGGFSSRIGPDGINAYFAQVDENGVLLKENAHGTPGYDRITGLAPTRRGFIGAGHVEGLDGRDFLIIGFDRIGVELWRKSPAGKGSNGLLYVEPTPDGNFIAVGGTDEAGHADIVILKIDENGETLWRRDIGGDGTDTNHGVVVLSDGRILVAGYTTSWGAGEADFMAALLSPAGEPLRIETFGGLGDERLINARLAPDGSIWLTGHTKTLDPARPDILVTRLNARGELHGDALVIGGAGEDVGTVALPAGPDASLLAAYSDSLGGGGQDAILIDLRSIRFAVEPRFTVTRVK